MSGSSMKIKVLETPEDIAAKREQVLSRYDAFKRETEFRRIRLEQAKKFQYFKRDSDALEMWIKDKIRVLETEDFTELNNIQEKKRMHENLTSDIQAHAEILTSLDSVGDEMIIEQHYASEEIENRLLELHALWDRLLALFQVKSQQLDSTLRYVQFLRSADDLLSWAREKEVYLASDEYGDDFEHVEAIQQKFDEFLKDFEEQKDRVGSLHCEKTTLIDEGFPEQSILFEKSREVDQAFLLLDEAANIRRRKLDDARKFQKYFRDVDKAMLWMNEKSGLLSMEDCGHDWETVQALHQKQMEMDKDLAVLEEGVKVLGASAKS